MKKYAMCFLVGGGLSIIAEAILQLLIALGTEFFFAITLMLAIMAFLGAVLSVVGLYPRFEKIGEYGAMLPFCGFASAIVAITRSSLDQGKSRFRAILDGWTNAGIIFGIGFLVAFTLAAVVHFL